MKTAVNTHQPLSRARRRFIDLWGEMASTWGISRTMAQIYALLYSSPTPMDTDEVMEVLDISRGNANMNLHKLVEWGIVNKADRTDRDSRKDFYYAEKDVWLLTSRIIRERNEREIMPVVENLGQIAGELENQENGGRRELSKEEADFKRQLEQMADFMALFNSITSRILPLLEHRNLKQIESLLKLLGAGDGKKPSKGY